MWWHEWNLPRTRCWDLNADSGTFWRPCPRTFWRFALAHREPAFGRCRRAGIQISGLETLQRFPSMRVNLRINSEDVWDVCGSLCDRSFAFLGRCSLFATGDLSRPGISLFTLLMRLFLEWELRFSRWSKVLVPFQNAGDLKGPMRATPKPRGALDEEVGLSDRNLFILKDYQALCLARAVFPEVPGERHAAKDWRVLCARRQKTPRPYRGARV